MNTMIRYNNPAASLSNILDNLFSGNVFEAADRAFTKNWPKVDITENADGYTIKADLPGLDKSDISIVIDNGSLRIEGERKDDYKKEEGMYYHLERSCGKFSRSFALSEEIDEERVEARMSNGVLEVSLHKHEKAKPRMIDVKIE